MATAPKSDLSSSSIFSQKASRLQDDTVFYAIFPDFTLSQSTTNSLSSSLQTLHLQISQTLSPFTSDYIWQHEPLTLSLSSIHKPSCLCSNELPHLHGKLRYGDNLDDEWFSVFLLFEISRNFPNLSIRVWDTDGEFLLIESAFHLPRWIDPDSSLNRVFIRRGDLHIVPRNRLPNPSLAYSLKFLVEYGEVSRASESVQTAVKNRMSEYQENARKNMHRVRVRVPVSVAQVLKHEPCLISLAVEGFYDRDIDSMKHAAKMERFLSKGREEDLVGVSAKMSRAMYAQLVQQKFQAPKCYPMPYRSDGPGYLEAEMGMKIACGFEMMYQQRKKEGLEGKGSTWEAFKETLDKSGYFEGQLPGSKEYRRLMQSAEEYYRNSSSISRASETMNAPVRRIDEILALPHSADDFKGQEIPPSDDDSWMFNGEDDLNAALLERQKEMELYSSKNKNKKKLTEQESGQSSRSNNGDFDPSEIANNMRTFIHKISSYKGAEVPEDRNFKEVDLDVDYFYKDLESIMKQRDFEDAGSDDDIAEGSSSDMDFDDLEDDGDIGEAPEGTKDGEDSFAHSYSEVLNEELQSTDLNKSFVRAKEQVSQTKEGTSNSNTMEEDIDEDFTPVDVDMNLVKSLLDSFSSQEGLPGPASNLLGLMGLQLKDANKNK